MATKPSWISVNPGSGSGEAEVKVTASRNSASSQRSGTVTVKTSSGLSKEVLVSQKAPMTVKVTFNSVKLTNYASSEAPADTFIFYVVSDSGGQEQKLGQFTTYETPPEDIYTRTTETQTIVWELGSTPSFNPDRVRLESYCRMSGNLTIKVDTQQATISWNKSTTSSIKEMWGSFSQSIPFSYYAAHTVTIEGRWIN